MAQTSFHSTSYAPRPRRVNRLTLRTSLMWPNTGSIVWARFGGVVDARLQSLAAKCVAHQSPERDHAAL